MSKLINCARVVVQTTATGCRLQTNLCNKLQLHAIMETCWSHCCPCAYIFDGERQSLHRCRFSCNGHNMNGIQESYNQHIVG